MAYRCERCGDVYSEDDPPCDNCGHQWFEEVTADVDSTGDLVWACTECGNLHVKNSPPCNRCGNHTFRKRDADFEVDDATAPGYLDLIGPGYVAAVAVGLAVLAILVLVILGVVPLPEALGGQPTVGNAPGNASTAGGLSLDRAESAFLAAANDRRTSAGQSELSRDDRLDAMATYYNQKRVKADYADGEPPELRGLPDRFDYRCSNALSAAWVPDGGDLGTVGEFETAAALGEGLAAAFDGTEVVTGNHSTVGVDVHAAPDGTVYAAVFVC